MSAAAVSRSASFLVFDPFVECLCIAIFCSCTLYFAFFFFQAEDGIRDGHVTGVQTCALPISVMATPAAPSRAAARAIPAPRPWVAPLISTTLSVSSSRSNIEVLRWEMDGGPGACRLHGGIGELEGLQPVVETGGGAGAGTHGLHEGIELAPVGLGITLEEERHVGIGRLGAGTREVPHRGVAEISGTDRKSTRLNSSHVANSYAVFRLK